MFANEKRIAASLSAWRVARQLRCVRGPGLTEVNVAVHVEAEELQVGSVHRDGVGSGVFRAVRCLGSVDADERHRVSLRDERE